MVKILLITDNKAGHESVSKGLIEYIKTKHDIEVVEITAKIRIKFFNYIGRIICKNMNLTKSTSSLLIKLFYKKIDLEYVKECNLIISAGGDTALLNIFLSQKLSLPNILISSLRGLPSKYFKYTVSITNNNLKNEIVVDLPPIFMKLSEKTLEGKYIAVLLGGPTKNYHFKKDEFMDMLKNTIKLAKRYNYKILLTTSRRTPEKFEKEIEKIYKEDNSIFEKVVLFNQKPKKVMNYFLANADIVFCTEDSGSMITESILSRKKVYTFYPKDFNLDQIFKIFKMNITEKKYIHSYSISKMNEINLKEDFECLKSLPIEKVYNSIRDELY